MSADVISSRYDGTSSFPDSAVPAQTPAQRAIQLTVTAVLVAGPFAGLVAAVWLLWATASVSPTSGSQCSSTC
jgi:hypothetical protein